MTSTYSAGDLAVLPFGYLPSAQDAGASSMKTS
jgi:hypothetical protein